MFLTSPTSTHAVANAAWTSGLRPLVGKKLSPDGVDHTKDGAGS